MYDRPALQFGGLERGEAFGWLRALAAGDRLESRLFEAGRPMMKTPTPPNPKKPPHPYTPPVLTKQQNLKDITLFTDLMGPEGERGGRGGGDNYDDRI